MKPGDSVTVRATGKTASVVGLRDGGLVALEVDGAVIVADVDEVIPRRSDADAEASGQASLFGGD